jgi:hypothetical protein
MYAYFGSKALKEVCFVQLITNSMATVLTDNSQVPQKGGFVVLQ